MSPRLIVRGASPTLAALLLIACGAHREGALRADLRAQLHRADPHPPPAPADGELAQYVAYAASAHPSIRADYERWRAAVHRIEPARRMPDPMVTYAFYASSVQTRVGPQRHRLGARQEIPWPTQLTAAADAQAYEAQAAQRRMEARLLALRAPVAAAWWRLWAVRRTREVQRERLILLDALAEAARARLEVGHATLADVGQLDLARARQDDGLRSLDEEERTAEAALRAAIAAPADVELTTARDVAPASLPAQPAEALAEAVRAHPRLEAFELSARAREAQAGAVEGTRFPSFVLGVDWIETGEAPMPVNGSGDDAFMVSVGVRVPIFGQAAADDAMRAQEAEAAAARADREVAELSAIEALHEALGALRETHRRLRFYERTLLPQARGVYESVAGAYATGSVGVAEAIRAAGDLLDIELDAIRARAQHGAAWARVEALTGRPAEREVGDE